MFIAKLIDDCDISLKRFAFFADRRLNKEIKTKITHGALWNDMFCTVNIFVMRPH